MRTRQTIGVATFLVVCASADAQPNFYDIDSLASQFNVDFTVLGLFDVLPQNPGSLSTNFGGTANTDRDGDAMWLNSKAVAENSGVYEPGNAPGNLGFFIDLGSLGTVTGAVRGLSFDMSTDQPAQYAGGNANGSFEAVQQVSLTGGAVELGATGDLADNLDGFVFDLTGQEALTDPSNGTRMQVGDESVIQYPFSFDIQLDDPVEMSMSVSGYVEGRGPIPAPATLSLLMLGACAASRRQR